jgi:hypothetical protein
MVILSGGLALAQVPQSAVKRPPWVTEGVPDTVWLLVEATYAEDDGDRVKELLKDAEAHARLAVEGHEDDIGRRFALAVVMGRRADREGGRTKVRVASEFHEELLAILGMDPKHTQARHLMGRLYAGVRRMGTVTRWIATNLLGGNELKKATWDAAEEHLAFAEMRDPGVADYHLQLANLYRDTDRPEMAAAEARHVMELPATTPLEQAVRAEAEALIEQMEKR